MINENMINETMTSAILAAIVVFSFSQTALAQQATQTAPPRAYTLGELETTALQNNLSLVISRLDVTQSEKDVVTAGLRPNPIANITGDVLNSGSTQYGLVLSVPIELGGKRGYRIESAEALTNTARLRLLDNVRQTLLGVRIAYWDVLGAQESVRIADSNLTTYDKLVALNELRFQQHQIAQTELLRSQLASEQAGLQRSEAALNLRKAQNNLLLALGSKDATPIAVRDSLRPLSRVIPSFEQLQQTAFTRRADLLAARSLKQAAEANQRLQEANGMFDVSVSADYLVQQGTPFYGVSGQIPIPIFNRNQGEREKAVIKLEQSDRQADFVALGVTTDVQSAFAEIQTRTAALQKFRSAINSSGSTDIGILARATSIKTASEFAYKSGSISLLELLDAVRTYNDIYKSYIDALTLYNKSIATLDAAVGADNGE